MSGAPHANGLKRSEPQTVALMKEYLIFYGAKADWLEAKSILGGDWEINYLRHFPGNHCQYMDLPKRCIEAIERVLPDRLAAPGNERAILIPFLEGHNQELETKIYQDANFAAWYAEQERGPGLEMKAPQTAAGAFVAGKDAATLLGAMDDGQQAAI